MHCPQIGTAEQNLNKIGSVRVADRPTARQGRIGGLPSLAVPKMAARAVARKDTFAERALLIQWAWLVCESALDHRDVDWVRGFAWQGYDLSQVAHQRRDVC